MTPGSADGSSADPVAVGVLEDFVVDVVVLDPLTVEPRVLRRLGVATGVRLDDGDVLGVRRGVDVRTADGDVGRREGLWLAVGPSLGAPDGAVLAGAVDGLAAPAPVPVGALDGREGVVGAGPVGVLGDVADTTSTDGPPRSPSAASA